MGEVLVVANQTLAGRALLEAVRERAAAGADSFRLVVPMTKPGSGLVIYDEAVRDAAQVRVDLALAFLANEGIVARGEVGDADPFSATMDAIAERRPSEIIISTKPAASSGWLRRDLIERVAGASGLPVHHVVTDLEGEGLPYRVTLVVAHRTSSGEELIEHLVSEAGDATTDHLFIGVVPQDDGSGDAPRKARVRLAAMLERLGAAGLLASGMIGDPDPFTATMNALQLFRVDDVVISTLPGERSGWLRSNLIERVRGATTVPVAHVVVSDTAATTTTLA